MAALSRPTITWSTGGQAEISSANGVQTTVRSTCPFPPGAPVPGTLTEPSSLAFTLKVAGVRKVDEQIWEIRGRLVAATSEVLAAFAHCANKSE